MISCSAPNFIGQQNDKQSACRERRKPISLSAAPGRASLLGQMLCCGSSSWVRTLVEIGERHD
jgi:hypothetical protein